MKIRQSYSYSNITSLYKIDHYHLTSAKREASLHVGFLGSNPALLELDPAIDSVRSKNGLMR
jgi:hypothetical protein